MTWVDNKQAKYERDNKMKNRWGNKDSFGRLAFWNKLFLISGVTFVLFVFLNWML